MTRTRAHPADPRRIALLAFGVFALLVGHAPDAAACSSCFTATEATRQAYYGTTLLLAALPFALAGALGVWLRRAARRRAFTPSG